jgi:hypothetical protein
MEMRGVSRVANYDNFGVTAENAEKALKTLMSQYLIGASKSLQ